MSSVRPGALTATKLALVPMSWAARRLTLLAVTRVSAMPSSRMLPWLETSVMLLPARRLPSFRLWSPVNENWLSSEL